MGVSKIAVAVLALVTSAGCAAPIVRPMPLLPTFALAAVDEVAGPVLVTGTPAEVEATRAPASESTVEDPTLEPGGVAPTATPTVAPSWKGRVVGLPPGAVVTLHALGATAALATARTDAEGRFALPMTDRPVAPVVVEVVSGATTWTLVLAATAADFDVDLGAVLAYTGLRERLAAWGEAGGTLPADWVPFYEREVAALRAALAADPGAIGPATGATGDPTANELDRVVRSGSSAADHFRDTAESIALAIRRRVDAGAARPLGVGMDDLVFGRSVAPAVYPAGGSGGGGGVSAPLPEAPAASLQVTPADGGYGHPATPETARVIP